MKQKHSPSTKQIIKNYHSNFFCNMLNARQERKFTAAIILAGLLSDQRINWEKETYAKRAVELADLLEKEL